MDSLEISFRGIGPPLSTSNACSPAYNQMYIESTCLLTHLANLGIASFGFDNQRLELRDEQIMVLIVSLPPHYMAFSGSPSDVALPGSPSDVTLLFDWHSHWFKVVFAV